MAYVQNYYDPKGRCFGTIPGEDRIAVPAYVLRTMREAELAGKSTDCDENDVPVAVASLLTKRGMQEAVFAELREQRAGVLTALAGVGFDCFSALRKLPPPATPDPYEDERSKHNALLDAVDAAREFLKNITTDAQVLAVEPGTGPNQGAEYMRQLVLYKYKVYAATSLPDIRKAFAEVAT